MIGAIKTLNHWPAHGVRTSDILEHHHAPIHLSSLCSLRALPPLITADPATRLTSQQPELTVPAPPSRSGGGDSSTFSRPAAARILQSSNRRQIHSGPGRETGWRSPRGGRGGYEVQAVARHHHHRVAALTEYLPDSGQIRPTGSTPPSHSSENAPGPDRPKKKK